MRVCWLLHIAGVSRLQTDVRTVEDGVQVSRAVGLVGLVHGAKGLDPNARDV